MTRSSVCLAGIEPERICIIKPSSLGDVVHALPILSALRSRWPSSHLTWVVNAPFREVLLGHPDLDELIVYDRKGQGIDRLGINGMAGVLGKLGRGRYDLTIDLQGLLRSALMAAATRAKIRVGMADAREGARWFYTHHIEAPRLGLHAVERVLRVSAELGADVSQPRFNLPIAEADRCWATEVLVEVPRPRVILNLGARWLTKRWPPKHYAEIGRRVASNFGGGLIAVGAREDRPLVDALARHAGPLRVLDLCGQTRLPQLAALSLESDLMISNDTGPLHLAAAAGARVLGIYTCTSPKLTGPFGPRATTVQSCIWCAPSFLKNCSRLECMSELTPDHVWSLVRDQLDSAIGPRIVSVSGRRRATGQTGTSAYTAS
ncbi:MAG: glycosyltransferase family 9 protein [Isosphaeraceae bacterium]